jgi:hypothetical protein
MDRVDRITDASEGIRAVLETRTVLLHDGITHGRTHPGWVGPISWELAEAAVDALDAEEIPNKWTR